MAPQEGEKNCHEESSVMLPGSHKGARILTVSESERPATKNRKESLRDFIRNLGSVASLPGHHGKPYSSSTGVLHQCLATFVILILSASTGQPIGFSAVLLPQLYVENSTLRVDLEMGSWIASLHSAATPVGSLLAGPMMEQWGRLRCLQLSVLPLLAGWACLSLAPSLPVLLAGRLLCGYSVGSVAATGQVYLGEISDPKLRGFLSGSPFVSYSLGILLIFSIGRLPWRTVAATSAALPLLALVLLMRLPESPDWLARHARLTRAHDSVLWLRGDEGLAKKEIHQILMTSAKERDEQERSKDTFFTTIRKTSIMKPLIIINIFNALQIFSGTYTIVFYAVDIIEDIVGENIDSLLAAILTAVVRLIFAVIGCFLLFYTNRRTLCMISGVGSTIASLGLGFFIVFRLGEVKGSLDLWVTTGCMLFYIASNTLGFFMLPGIMVGELLPAKVRGMCGGYIFMIYNIFLFTFTKIFPSIKNTIGSHGLFLLFGTSSLLGTVFMFLFLPETKNKSLLQIEQYFEKSNFFWHTRQRMVSDSANI